MLNKPLQLCPKWHDGIMFSLDHSTSMAPCRPENSPWKVSGSLIPNRSRWIASSRGHTRYLKASLLGIPLIRVISARRMTNMNRCCSAESSALERDGHHLLLWRLYIRHQVPLSSAYFQIQIITHLQCTRLETSTLSRPSP